MLSQTLSSLAPIRPAALNSRLDLLTDYPFQRLTQLLEGIKPGAEPLSLSIGEPQHAPPPMVATILAGEIAGWGKYPPVAGTPEFRSAVGAWLKRRFELPAGALDSETQIIPVSGTREALYQIAQLVCDERPRDSQKPVVLLPNPFYQVYAGAALMAGAEPIFVPATRETHYLPQFQTLAPEILERTVLAYICSPANPQGAVASAAELDSLVGLARHYGFTLASDECYSELYNKVLPPGALSAAFRTNGTFDNVVVFHSLSKRSSVPGLRSGFVAGDKRLIAAFRRMRSYGGAAIPLPLLKVSEALWRDEAHVEVNRALYRAKFDLAEKLLAGRNGFYRPDGGFYLWLDVGHGEEATVKLWREAGLRVLPGAYLARDDAKGFNPGAAYIRIALVQDLAATERALTRLRDIL